MVSRCERGVEKMLQKVTKGMCHCCRTGVDVVVSMATRLVSTLKKEAPGDPIDMDVIMQVLFYLLKLHIHRRSLLHMV